MKNYTKKSLKASNGITLIALVITIIVLLILAGISISMLSGDNSILQKATEAKEYTERAEIVENAKIDVLNEITENKGNDLQESQLKSVLENYFIKSEIPEELPSDLSTVELTTLNEKYKIKVSEIYNGKLSKSGNNNIDWEAIFADAVSNPEKYKHPDQQNSNRIALGPSGKPVNLDLWNITGDTNGYTIAGNTYYDMTGPHVNPGYLGGIVDGKINGEMPMYVQLDVNSNQFIPIIALESTFSNMSPLIYDPIIPDTVTNIGDASFFQCGLTSINIPSNVTSIGDSAFKGCPLINITLPSKLTYIGRIAFWQTSLGSITIPASVTTVGQGGLRLYSSATIYVPFKENEKPAGWDADWDGYDHEKKPTIIYSK